MYSRGLSMNNHSREQVNGDLCRQVVLVKKCISITEVAHGAAYCGHYRQVVFKTDFTVTVFI